MDSKNKAYVQIYTGNGKGKSTAALGLALRMAGSGQNVFLAQFVKSITYSEIKIIAEYLPMIEHKQYGISCLIDREPTDKDRRAAQEGLEEIKQVIVSKKYSLVILDEINIALYYKLIEVDVVADLIKNKPKEIELVLTGRYAPKVLIDLADLVTEMQEIKHYYSKGILSRKGIEY